MKAFRLFNLTLCAFLIASLCGCIGPLKRFSKAQKKVDNAQAAIATNRVEQQDIGRNFTFAANQALKSDPTPSRESQVAEDMTERALLAEGLPPAADAAALRQMASDLVSTNVEVNARGEKALSARDAELAKSQERGAKLGQQLTSAEQRLREVSQANAALASKWVRMRHIAEWLVGGIVFLFLLFVAVQVLPIIFPELGAARSALHGVVSAVEAVRTKIAASHPELAKEVDATLAVAAPPNSRAAATIDGVKKTLGL